MNKQEVSRILNFIKEGKYSLAEKNIVGLINDNPKIYFYQNLLAITYASQKKFNDSIVILEKIIKYSPKFIDAYINLGNIYNDLNQLEKSAEYFKKALSIDTNHITAQFNFADVLDKQSKFNKSAKIYKSLIKKESNNLDYLINYASNQIKSKKLANANKILNKILELDPNNTKAIVNLGVIQKDNNNFNKATQYLKKAIEINPNLSEAYYNLGIVEEKSEKYAEAISSFKKAIEIKPLYAEAHYNLGCVFEKLGKKSDALIKYKTAIQHKNNYIKALFNLARVQLAMDDFKNGWIGHEQRKGGIISSYKSLGIQFEQIWNGSKFNDPLVVLGEQGIGDEILYSSIFRDLEKYHSNLIIYANNRLIPIMERSFPQIKFISRHERNLINKNILSNYKHIFAGSLGKIFRNSLNDFNNKTSWLSPCPKRQNEFIKRLSSLTKIKVGISWKSSGVKSKDRNIPLHKLASLFPNNDFEIINLQYGEIGKDKKVLEKTKEEN